MQVLWYRVHWELLGPPKYVSGCQNCGPFLGSYYNMAPNISGTQKGTIVLTTTHVGVRVSSWTPEVSSGPVVLSYGVLGHCFKCS